MGEHGPGTGSALGGTPTRQRTARAAPRTTSSRPRSPRRRGGPLRPAAPLGAGRHGRRLCSPTTPSSIATSRSSCCRRARLERPTGARAAPRGAGRSRKLSHPNVIAVYDVGTARRACSSRWSTSTASRCAWSRERSAHAWPEVLEVLLAGRAGTRGRARCRHRAPRLQARQRDDRRGRTAARARLRARARARGEIPTESNPRTSSADRPRPRVVGTIGYIAPEQFLGDPPDMRSDQFGFCVTAWEALLGRVRSRGGPAASTSGRCSPVRRPARSHSRARARDQGVAPRALAFAVGPLP